MFGCTNISKFDYTNIPMFCCTRVHTLTTFRPWRLPGHHGSPDGHRDQRPALHRHGPQDLRLLLLHLTHHWPLHPLLLRGPLQGRGPLRCWRCHLWHWWRCCSEGLLREWQVHWSCPGACCKNISVLSSKNISVEFIVKYLITLQVGAGYGYSGFYLAYWQNSCWTARTIFTSSMMTQYLFHYSLFFIC